MINLRRLVVLLACLWAAPAFAQTSGQIAGDLGALNACLILPVAGMGTGSVQLIGTWAGTVSFTVANTGDAADYKLLNMAPSNSSTQVTSSTSNGLWSGSVAGYRFFRACMTSYTSGRASLVLSAAATGGGGAGSVAVDLTGASFSGNAAASATGAAIPAQADYLGINVGGTLTGLASGQTTMANSIPVTLASNQSSLTVLPGNTANTTAWLVTGTGGTFPATQSGTWNVTNISGTVSLPTGASTAAKQPALGTAGSASADVLSIQGIASMTPLLTTLSGTNSIRLQDGSGNALTSMSAGAQRAITVSVVDNSGNQVSSFGGSGGTSSAFGSTFPSGASSGSAVGFNDGTNMQGARVVDADTGGGTFYTMATNSVFRASGTPVEAGTSSNPWNVVFPSTQAVSGPLTDTQLRATAVPVSGTVTATGPVTDTQLRASAVPVSLASLPSGAVTNAGTFAVQVTSLPAIPTGANVIGALSANQTVNVAQINGVTPLMGAGNTGTGSQRVTIASDQAAIPITVATIPSHAVTNAGTFSVQVTSMPADATELPAASALADAMANPTTPLIGAAMMAYNGTTWDRLQPALDYAQNSTTSGQTGSLVQGAVTTSAPTYTSGRTSPVSLDTSGSLRVAVVSGSTGNAAASNTGSAVPTQAGYTGINVAGTLRGQTGVNPSGTIYAGQVDMAAIAGATASVNNGTVDAGTLRVTVASNSSGVIGVVGAKTNNNAAPGATNVGALVALANAAAPSWTEGNLVALSTDLSGALRVSGGGGGTQYTQDAALTVATSVGNMAMGRASAAAPTDVSADNDAVMPWYLRSGAQVSQPAFAGVLATTGNGVSGTGVQRVTIASDSTGQLKITDAAGNARGANVNAANELLVNPYASTPSASAYQTFRITDGTSYITPSTDYVQDAALTVSTTTGGMTMGRASAAAPTDVSNDNDAAMAWYLRSGATVTNPSFAGVLATTGNGVSGTGVQRVTIASDSTGVIGVVGAKTNNNAAPGATNVGALVALANASAPTWTEGNLVALSTDLTGALRVSGGGGGTQYTQDAALTVASSVGNLSMGRASAAAPTDVSADNDAVMPWYLRSGAQAVQSTFGGVLATAGNGVSGTGVQRVTLASDSTGQVALATGSNTIGALTANQSVNYAQVNGVTVSTGVGASGTGVQRVVDVASGTTGAAPPAQAKYIGGLQSGATGGFLGGITACDLGKTVNISTATTTLLVTGVSGRQVRICSYHLFTAAANNVALIEGTGATCGTGSAGLAGGTTAASGYNFGATQGIATGSGLGEVMTTATTGDSVCVVTSAATQLSGYLKYTIY